jgi:hypothetical protein
VFFPHGVQDRSSIPTLTKSCSFNASSAWARVPQVRQIRSVDMTSHSSGVFGWALSVSLFILFRASLQAFSLPLAQLASFLSFLTS